MAQATADGDRGYQSQRGAKPDVEAAVDYACRLGRHQQFVSRYEIGERRLDVIEFTDVARSLGLDAAHLVSSIG